ncbi:MULTISPECIES: class E sortase [Prauserella salsuginis group]|uniref:Sortase (Surface protein transpeptidase) n=2 Tax=Prauserella salsuginis group TaxID=2893672 RepID=A0A839XMB5_9PSEU|nr:MULTISPECIES: class E sortase [Prauserella salsuginis group]MBB3662664.1 sortase (surface protein transpeptidase) [Prauserella sediminis]MCR3720362.1 LPXTG-site transpeptidase (sortase) family protein [Prauserella flava]MCR3733929.1 LPXTG-site transpeptidase (sortase) family protein [Prauserella salsuginis]
MSTSDEEPPAARVPATGAESSAVSAADRPPAPPPRPRGGKVRTAVRGFGEVLITLGLVLLLFVVYELYVTNWKSGRLQNEASAQLEQEWRSAPQGDRELHVDPADGQAFARMYIPTFGVDWSFTVQEGVGPDALEIGPGHYKNTEMPGQPGNVGIAGHRVGKGAPFNDLDLLNSCDPVVIETGDSFYVYRVLPMRDEVDGWADGKGRQQRCANVAPLQDKQHAYDETFGRRIVLPDRGDAVAPVPYKARNPLPKASQASLLTLTTCHPQFSDAERMIIHGVLTNQYKKSEGTGYDDLLAEIGEA